MLVAADPIKPAMWAFDPARISPWWEWAWVGDRVISMPFWEPGFSDIGPARLTALNASDRPSLIPTNIGTAAFFDGAGSGTGEYLNYGADGADWPLDTWSCWCIWRAKDLGGDDGWLFGYTGDGNPQFGLRVENTSQPVPVDVYPGGRASSQFAFEDVWYLSVCRSIQALEAETNVRHYALEARTLETEHDEGHDDDHRSAGDVMMFGRNVPSGENEYTGDIALFHYVEGLYLSVAQIEQLVQDPFGPLRPERRVIVGVPAGGGGQAVTGAHISSTVSLNAPTVEQRVIGATIASESSLAAPTLAYAASAAFLASTLNLFAPTIAVGAVEITGAHIAAGTTVTAPGVEQNIRGVSIGSSVSFFAPSVAGGVGAATVASGAVLFVPTLVQTVVGATIGSSVSLAVPAVSHEVVGATIASTVTLSAPTTTYALVGATVGATTTLSAPTVALASGPQGVTGAHLASGLSLFAPTVTHNLEGATIGSGATLHPPTVAIDQSVGAAAIASGLTLFAPTVAYNVAGSHLTTGLLSHAPSLSLSIGGATASPTTTLYAPTVVIIVSGIPSSRISTPPAITREHSVRSRASTSEAT